MQMPRTHSFHFSANRVGFHDARVTRIIMKSLMANFTRQFQQLDFASPARARITIFRSLAHHAGHFFTFRDSRLDCQRSFQQAISIHCQSIRLHLFIIMSLHSFDLCQHASLYLHAGFMATILTHQQWLQHTRPHLLYEWASVLSCN